MTTVLEIIRPEPVKIRIFGEEHEIRRLRYPAASKAVMSLVKILTADGGKIIGQIEDVVQAHRDDGVGGVRIRLSDILNLIVEGGEEAVNLVKGLLEESLPTFEGFDELPLEDAFAILGEIFRVNRIMEMIPRFFATAAKGR